MLIDNILAGRILGSESFGAMGVVAPVSLVFSAFGNICSGGGGARAAQALGRGERDRFCLIFTTNILFVITIGSLLTVFGMLFTPQIALLLGAKGVLFEPAKYYLYGFFMGTGSTLRIVKPVGWLQDLSKTVFTGFPTAISRISDTFKVMLLNNLLVTCVSAAAVTALNVRTTSSNFLGAVLLGIGQAATPTIGMFFGEEDRTAVKDTLNLLSLCIEEMAGNVVRHAFKPGEKRWLDLTVIDSSEEVILRIRDNGSAFDPLAYDYGADSAGYGTRMIRKLADNFEYRRSMGLNNLIIHLRKRSAKPTHCDRTGST